jgi:superfamily II DNA or RNA helicase
MTASNGNRQQDYQTFLATKERTRNDSGVAVADGALHSALFPFQRDITRWALKKGRAAIFADTGMGKTLMQLEWARLLNVRTLILAPLSVARQTVREASKINLCVHYTRSNTDLSDGINITNYEMIEAFDPTAFGAVVLDESSLLKCLAGKTRKRLTDMFSETPFRLCCTATPAPNDYVELGNHADFLGVCTQAEMLSMFFINANKQQVITVGDTTHEIKGSNSGGQEWRLKRHAEDAFFRWLATWAMTLTRPSDLGYDDDGFILPPLTIHKHIVPTTYQRDDELVFTGLKGISDRSRVRRSTLEAKIDTLHRVVNSTDGQLIVWTGLNEESRAVTEQLPQAVEIVGSDSPERKAQAFEEFQDGIYNVLVTKGSIAGYGMNFQNAHQMIFFGLNDSWETYYQCIRREWRYGQQRPVDVHIIISDAEEAILHNIYRKDALAQRLRERLIDAMKEYEMNELEFTDGGQCTDDYREDTVTGKRWLLMLGDSASRLMEIPDNSVGLSVYSPPFVDLFTYSNTHRDLGNCYNRDQFFSHYAFIIRDILRVTQPGRLTCVHTSDIPAMASRDGYIGVKDFPGDVIRSYELEGWIFVGRAFVQKNPQAQAIRTKSKALLFIQLRKDSSDSRPALVDQILLFRKPGENAVPVTPVENGEIDNETWIEWANGIWLGIHESDTLNYSRARAESDEKHVCPLQLGVIERCIKLYSNPGETILSPFAGIGSEGYMAVKLGRSFIGCELKPSYYRVAQQNLTEATRDRDCQLPFALVGD